MEAMKFFSKEDLHWDNPSIGKWCMPYSFILISNGNINFLPENLDKKEIHILYDSTYPVWISY